jgi:3-methylcrotonyl-CoA carboxylase alpha subunit
MPFKKLLIANRGEIAVRIARTCARLGIGTVAVYSDADARALHTRVCDEAYHIGSAPATDSYLRGDRIIEVATRAGCDAIHPGYGFLAENADFAQAVMDAGLAWVGPPPRAIALMGSKIQAKRLAEQHGVPVVPGYFGDDQSPDRLRAEAERIGYPVLIKASAGGGGKGMRVVNAPDRFDEELEGARREALAAFGDDTVMLEKYLTEPRHIEVQVLGDQYGTLIHLGERECSIQRRHQKVLEECPSPAVDETLRERMAQAALALAKAVGYTNAGTVEFVYEQGDFYFLEMNTRLQVEHPVTEQVTGIDLVEAQLRIAAGEPLWLDQPDVQLRGHAVEVRLYAEDPATGFLPATGTLQRFRLPTTDRHIRVDTGVTEGDAISPYYDPMIAKVIAEGETRLLAFRKLQDALSQIEIEGPTTNLHFLRWLVAHPQVLAGNTTTTFIARHFRPEDMARVPVEVPLAAAAAFLLDPSDAVRSSNSNRPDVWAHTGWRLARQQLSARLMVEGRPYEVVLSGVAGEPDSWRASVLAGEPVYEGVVELSLSSSPSGEHIGSDGTPVAGPSVQMRLDKHGPLYTIRYVRQGDGVIIVRRGGREYRVTHMPPLSTDRLSRAIHLRGEESLQSPMPGKVLKVLASEGQPVEEQQPLVIIEAMKMEFTVRAPHAGRVARVYYREGDQVSAGDVLVELEKAGDE